jgi:hypothetical protein
VFNHIATTFVDGFVARADKIYKKDLAWAANILWWK